MLAWELLVTGIAIGACQIVIDARSQRSDREKPVTLIVGRTFPAVVSCGCPVIAGGTLLARAGGGLYWLVPSVLAAISFGLVNVWVLLVEILRCSSRGDPALKDHVRRRPGLPSVTPG